jgi:hypothetical protein
MLILGGAQLIPEESTPNLASGPLGVHREDSISLSDGSWEVVGWKGKRIDLYKGGRRRSFDVKKAKQEPDFDWLYESPEGRFSVGCPHH